MKTKSIILCAIFAAFLCIFSVITIPIGIVPITLGTFGIMLASAILGWREGTISVIVFILIGAVGIPVFSGFKGGVSVIAGPTGGYIWSYIIMALITGALTRKLAKKPVLAMIQIALACIAGVAVCYFFGTLQFVFVQNTTFAAALGMCVIPFIPFDILKAVVAGYIAYTVRMRLSKAGLLQNSSAE